MNLDRTSDPYCILRFVDHLAIPINKSNITGFRTKHVLATLNPVWNQQVVFHSDSGFQRATYAHIEVWDRDVVTADTCMGEVFIPLKDISFSPSSVTLPLDWSPLMPQEYKSC
jgi:Ca2+-dependent lipid-binding protein